MKTRVLSACLFLSSTALFGASSCSGSCPEGSTLRPVQGKSLEGVKYAEQGYLCLESRPEVVGQPILGTYEYENAAKYGPPRVVLKRGGTGFFQKHGVTPQDMTWGIALKQNGAPAGVANENGVQLLFFYQLTSEGETECTPGLICDPANKTIYPRDAPNDWNVANLTIALKSSEPARVQKMWILGEREKACAAGENDGLTECTPDPDMDAPK